MKADTLIAKSLQDYAEFYFSKSLFVCPYSEESIDWNEWKYKELTKEDIKSYCWNTFDGISLVAGKKGIRVLKFMNIEEMGIMKVFTIIKEAFDILHLPDDYPWVVMTSNSIAIIVESADDIQGRKIGLMSDEKTSKSVLLYCCGKLYYHCPLRIRAYIFCLHFQKIGQCMWQTLISLSA